ncbi:hypothetical protein EH31_00815 [Erythrobacter longus]|uniref:DUF3429 domain-containing protein n=1 Tax=Erythrobacter longus TaxID=1044 RepID=A0A074M8X4_ERYLO|nr:DUF3429 domain-containing protein [Erythrobacter longus]KEO91236.1 hypothetical protein EH31_00815 [Erythrobacter longus]
MNNQTSLTPASRWLGYAGLLPQIICLGLAITGHEYAYTALAGGFAYGAAIFSFLGGVWWGQAIQSGRAGTIAGEPAGAGAYLIAVMPSLIAVALFLPWSFGWEWPGPALLYLGAFIALSPLVDRALGFAAPDFMRLRWHLSLGLGGLTIALGFASMHLMRSGLSV